MKVKTILVPTDFSESAQLAFEHAIELAQQTGAKLVLLHVQSGSAVRTAAREGLLRPGDLDLNIKQNVEKLVERRFSEMLAGHDVSGIKLKAEPLRGDPDSVISAYADWVDPGRTASVIGDAVRFVGRIENDWLARWRSADAELRAALRKVEILEHIIPNGAWDR